MPDQEFNVYHRFRPYFIIGQLDMTKEILIPKTKEFNGKKVQGYDVINPLYCYEGGKTSFKELFAGNDGVKIERSAIIVNRGWIPERLKDKRKRPTEINSRELVKLKGTFRKGKDIHDYKVPNNPNDNEWHNLSLEDIGIYWDIPNWDEAKFYYFQVLDLQDDGGDSKYTVPMTKEELVEEHYGWRWRETTHRKI